MTIVRLQHVLPLLGACLLPIGAIAATHDAPPARTTPPLRVAICDDENEWPPYSYYQRIDGKKTAQLTGYAVAVVGEIFARHGVSYKIDLIPWPRCVAVVNIGKQYGMVLNLSHSLDREKTFLFSRPYYATTAYYYYSKRNYPQGLRINVAADIGKYRVCGVQGYNYDGYGVKSADVDRGAKDFTALITKIQLGRCALFMEKDEVMVAYAAIGKNYLRDPDIGKAPIPQMKPNLFYFGISKNGERAEELRSLINESLLHMENNGRLAELLRQAITAASGKP
jgi:polar amino acid transport system substrate-binding protein